MGACKDCRYHHKSERRKALDVADGELELVEWADEPQVVFVCKHERQLNREMGEGPGCDLFEAPARKGLSPELERLLARREGR